MSLELALKCDQSFRETDRIGPEAVMGMGQIGLKQSESLVGCQGIRRELRIRENAHKSGFRERTSRPPFFCVMADPLLDFLMSHMSRPSGGDEDIHVQ